MGRRADMNVRAGRRAGDRAAKSYKRDPLRPQIGHQRLPLNAIRMESDVESATVIETEPVVDG